MTRIGGAPCVTEKPRLSGRGPTCSASGSSIRNGAERSFFGKEKVIPMTHEKSSPPTSPFNWQSTNVSVLDAQQRKNERLKAQLAKKAAGRVNALAGDLVNYAAPSQPKIKPK